MLDVVFALAQATALAMAVYQLRQTMLEGRKPWRERAMPSEPLPVARIHRG